MRRSKASFISKTLDNNRTDPKSFWNEINKLLRAGKSVGKSIKTIRTDKSKIVGDADAAVYMNDYYVNIGESLAKKFGNVAWEPYATFPSQTKDSFVLRMITEKECLSLIKQIDVNKSSAIDDLKSIFVKDAFLCLNFEVAYLLYESLWTSEFPAIMENKNRFKRDIDEPALMYTYRIQHIRQKRKVQLLSFMFTESKISDNIKSERPTMTLRRNNKVKFKEKITRKTAVLNSPLYFFFFFFFFLFNFNHTYRTLGFQSPVFRICQTGRYLLYMLIFQFEEQ